MKRWLLFVLLFGLLFATVVPVSAAGNGRSNFTLVGWLRGVDVEGKTVTIEVVRGNKLAQPEIGNKELTISVAYARILYNDGIVVTKIEISELFGHIGEPVSVHGTYTNGVWTVSRITVGAKLIHFP